MTGLISLARDMQREADTWGPRLVETGELDRDSLARMESLRQTLLLAKPENELDRLMQFGAIRSLVGFLMGLAASEPEHPADALRLILSGLVEIAIGLVPIGQKLETDAGQTLEDLGLFVDGRALQ